MKRKAWNATDRQMFADGLRTRASTYIDRRKHDNKQACRRKRWGR